MNNPQGLVSSSVLIALSSLAVIALFYIVYSVVPTERYVGTIPRADTQLAAISGAGSGLVAHYTFDDTTNDSAGSNHGTAVGGPTYVEGKIGKALQFDGVDDYVNMGDVLDMRSNDMTISMWIKTTNTSNGYLLSKSFAGLGNYRFGLKISNDGYPTIFMKGSGGVDFNLSGRLTVNDGNWHHLIFMFDRDSNAFIYLDGTFDNQSSIAVWNGQDFNSNYPFRIGAYTDSDNIKPYIPFRGGIDDVKIYNRTLSVQEISQLYQLENNIFTESSLNVEDDGIPSSPTPILVDEDSINNYVSDPQISELCRDLNIRCVDDTPGATQEYASVQACADVAVAGDTCLIYPGIYEEIPTTKAGGVSDTNRVIFRGSSPGQATLRGFNIDHPYITIENIDFSKYARRWHYVIRIGAGSNYLKFISNTIRDGVYIALDDVFLNSDGTITSVKGGFVSAGFKAGQTIEVGAPDDNPLLSTNRGGKIIQSVSENRITLSPGQSLVNEGPRYAYISPRTTSLIRFMSEGGSCARYGVLSNNKIYNVSAESIFDLNCSSDLLIENNDISKANGADIFRLFGQRTVIRGNYLYDSKTIPGIGSHPDIFQGWTNMKDIIIENNIFSSYIGAQIGRLQTCDSHDCTGVSRINLGNITIRNNVFYNITSNLTIFIPGVSVINNTFVSVGGGLGLHPVLFASLDKNRSATDGLIKDNAFVMNRPTERDDYLGWYEIQSYSLNNTANYNFVTSRSSKGWQGPLSGTTVNRFNEVNGISGGDPMFRDSTFQDNIIVSLAGPDGIPFTADDSFRPSVGSPLCAGGEGGRHIGAYSCGGIPPPSPLTLSSISTSNITQTGAQITWTTSAPATSQVQYGLTTAYGNNTAVSNTLNTLHSVSLTGLSPGTVYNYRASSTDATGNTTTSINYTFTTLGTSNPDTTPPLVSLTSPTPGSTHTPSSITVSANATDPSSPSGQATSGIAGVQFKLNNQNLGSEDTTAPYSVLWNASALPDGSYTLTAVARDVAGNTTTSSGVTITISTPTTPLVDTDQDGVPDTQDLCPGTPLNTPVNTRGCPLPKITTFSLTPSLSNTDLRSISSLEFGTTHGKITYPTGTYTLVRQQGSSYLPLDIDANLKITRGSITLNPINLPELNRPARLTFYDIPIPNATIMKDGAICTGCTNVTYDTTTKSLSFSITGFSTYSVIFDTPPDPEPTATSSISVSFQGTGSGIVSSGSIFSCTTNCTSSSTKGSTITITASPASDSTFTSWSGVCTNTDPSCTVSLASDISIVANFTKKPTTGGSSSRTVTISHSSGSSGSYINPAYLQVTQAPPTTSPGFPLSAVASGGGWTRYLTVGSTGNDVRLLQQTLNSLGFYVALPASAEAMAGKAGSPGNETMYYGPATTLAIQKFQCAVLQICSGSPTTNGYGNFGPQTRAALNARLDTTASVTSQPVTSVPPSTINHQPSTNITSWLTLGTRSPQVRTLQQILNSKGYTVSPTGPGSLGQETDYFGPSTLRALQMFQCATLQVCAGTPTTTGYGATGPRTRGELSK